METSQHDFNDIEVLNIDQEIMGNDKQRSQTIIHGYIELFIPSDILHTITTYYFDPFWMRSVRGESFFFINPPLQIMKYEIYQYDNIILKAEYKYFKHRIVRPYLIKWMRLRWDCKNQTRSADIKDMRSANSIRFENIKRIHMEIGHDNTSISTLSILLCDGTCLSLQARDNDIVRVWVDGLNNLLMPYNYNKVQKESKLEVINLLYGPTVFRNLFVMSWDAAFRRMDEEKSLVIDESVRKAMDWEGLHKQLIQETSDNVSYRDWWTDWIKEQVQDYCLKQNRVILRNKIQLPPNIQLQNDDDQCCVM